MPDPSARSGGIENLIVGSGLAALATAMALRRRGLPCDVIDVGYDIECDRQELAGRLAGQSSERWPEEARRSLFPPPVASRKGVEKRLLFGSDFPYRVPDVLSVRQHNCATELSHAIGGFGNVWGAAMLPYGAHNLRHWPVSPDAMEESYRNVLGYVPLSGENDGLTHGFPLYSSAVTQLRRTGQAAQLLAALECRKEVLQRNGILFGRARLAVDGGVGALGCRRCGMCLGGCVYGSIFNPRLLWKEIERLGIKVLSGHFVSEFSESDAGVTVRSIDVRTGEPGQWRCKRLFLAGGHIATARMIARSLGRFNEKVRIQDSQYFFFPLLSYRRVSEPVTFSLAEVFLEILNQTVSDEYLHFQIYGLNDIFQQELRRVIPGFLPLEAVAGRFYMIQGFLPSSESGHLELEVSRPKGGGDQVSISGVHNPRARTVAKRAQGLLRRALSGFGIVPPAYIQMVPPGRSFHAGGSFPMNGRHPVYASDLLGRPAGLKRVHIADSASFPSIASSTIGFTIMANADRIAMAVPDIA